MEAPRDVPSKAGVSSGPVQWWSPTPCQLAGQDQQLLVELSVRECRSLWEEWSPTPCQLLAGRDDVAGRVVRARVTSLHDCIVSMQALAFVGSFDSFHFALYKVRTTTEPVAMLDHRI